MTERDAFGNPIPDRGAATQPVTSGDPLDASATATATVSAPAAPTTSSPPPPLFVGTGIPTVPTYPPTRKSGWARAFGLLMILLFLAPFAVGGLVAWDAFHTAKSAIPMVKSLRDLAPATPSGNAPAKQAAAPPTGVTGASMLAAANLDRALRAARRDPGGKLGLLRVAPARADLQLARKGGGLDLLQLRADGGRSLVRTPGTGPTRTIVFSQIDTKAPARLVRSAARQLRRSPKAIDYVVLLDVLGGPRWSAYFTGGAAFQGDAHGHVTRRIQ